MIIVIVAGVVHHIAVELTSLSKILKNNAANIFLGGARSYLVNEVLDCVIIADP